MSSSLISVASVGASVALPGQSSSGAAAPKTLMDVFAGLLATAGGDAEAGAGVDITQSSSATVNGVELNGLAREIIAALLHRESPETPTAATPTAETPAAQMPPTDGASVTLDPTGDDTTESALSGLADLLRKIDVALNAGEEVDPDLLKKLGETIDALAAVIGGPITVAADAALAVDPATDIEVDIAAKGAAAAIDDPPGAPDGTEPVVPALKVLGETLKELAGKLEDTNGDLAQKLSVLAEKLGTLKTTVAELLEDAPELKVIIEALTQPKAETKTTAAAAFATPELRLPDNPSLSAKKVDGDAKTSAAAPAAAATPASPEAPPEVEVADAPKIQAKAEVKADTASAAPVEKRDASAQSPALAQQAPPPDTSITTGTAVSPTNAVHGVEHGSLRAVHSAYTPPSPINLPHMAFEIARQVQQGVSKFQIRLDPPEMGRIDVKLDMDTTGQVNARLTVERAETLDLLQRDQRSLERALAQAGLDASKTNLEFSLKQNPFAGQDGRGGQDAAGSPFGGDARGPVIAETEPTIATTLYRGTASAGGVNIFV